MNKASEFQQAYEQLLKAYGPTTRDVFEGVRDGQEVYSIQLVFADGSSLSGSAITEAIDSLPSQ